MGMKAWYAYASQTCMDMKGHRTAMANQIGTVKANGINVTVAEYFTLIRIYQDKDQILLTNKQDLDDLIVKLQAAKQMIESVRK